MPVTSYSRTPASNNSAPPNGAPEGWAPSAVNNTVRQIMTDIVNEAGKGAARVLGSVAGTDTITATMSPSLDAYSAGMIVVLTPANTNTGAVTLNIDTLGALDVLKGNGVALVAGDLAAGVPATLVLDSGADDFILVNPAAVYSGTYTPTLTNVANIDASTSAVCQWMRVGNVVTVSGVIEVDCTSGASTATTLRISLPVSSNFTAATQLGGTIVAQGGINPGSVEADPTNDAALCRWLATATVNTERSFSFTYRII